MGARYQARSPMKLMSALTLVSLLTGCTAASSQDSDQPVQSAQHMTASDPIPFGARVQIRSQDFVTVTRVETRPALVTGPDARRAKTGRTYVLIEYILKAPNATPDAISSFPTLSLVAPSGQVYTSMPEMEKPLTDDDGFSRRAAEVLKVNGQILDILVFEVPTDQFQRETWQVLTDNETHIALR